MSPEALREQLVRVLREPGKAREEALPEPHASVAVVLHLVGDALCMLWIRRAENEGDPWSGQMGFPGGKGEEGDASTRHTAERETLEEVGLDLDDHGEYLGELQSWQARNRKGKAGFKVVPHVFWVPELPELSPDPAEVAGTVSIPVAHLCDPVHGCEVEYQHRGVRIRLPAIDFEGRRLWGLSYKILRDFLERLERTSLGEVLRPRRAAR